MLSSACQSSWLWSRVEIVVLEVPRAMDTARGACSQSRQLLWT